MSRHAKHARPKQFRRPRAIAHTRAVSALGASVIAIAGLATAGAVSSNEPAHAQKPTMTAHTEPVVAKTTAPATVAKSAPSPAILPVKLPKLPVAPTPAAAPAPVYPDNLDGWIRESLVILKAHNIPASYEGIYRNVMRESTGNPLAINLYDSNAAAGIPSKGLLQVIDPTFAAYHVAGTKFDIYDPVANIVAACNYAAHNYGSMDNVDSAY